MNEKPEAKKDQELESAPGEIKGERVEERPEAIKEKKSQEPTPEEVEALNEERWNGIRSVMRNPDFDQAINNLASALGERQQRGLSEMGPPGTAQELSGIFKEFEDMRGRSTGRSEFGPVTARLNRCVGEIGEHIRRDQINDDPDSLGRLARSMERLEEACNALAGRLRVAEKPENPGDDAAINEAAVGLRRAADVLSDRKRAILAHRFAIEEYLDRRV